MFCVIVVKCEIFFEYVERWMFIIIDVDWFGYCGVVKVIWVMMED